jgi:hypothetical protein
MLVLIRYFTSSFSILCSPLVSYSTLIRSELQYAFVAWNSVTITDSSKRAGIKGNLHFYVTAHFLMAYVTINVKTF